MASALDTLCSQAFGSNDKKILGVILQRGLLIELVLSIFVMVLWGISGPLFALVKLEEGITELSALYVWINICGLYPLLAYEVLKKYLQAQGVVYPQMFVALGGNLLNIFANWLLVFGLGWGFVGAPIARVVTHWTFLISLLTYLHFSKRYVDTWGMQKTNTHHSLPFLTISSCCGRGIHHGCF